MIPTATLAAAAMLLGACGDGDEARTVKVSLSDYSIAPASDTVDAAKVRFDATNVGKVDHELVVLKTELAPGALPVSEGRVDEHATGVEEIGEIEEFKPGGTESATFDLNTGSYMLICNIAGHYEKGMYQAFTVN